MSSETPTTLTVFVPKAYLSPALHRRVLYIERVKNEGVSFTPKEFRERLRDGSINEGVLRDLAFRTY